MKSINFFGRMVCRLFGHRWKMVRDATRQCMRCNYRETLWLNRFPRIGEPQVKWGPAPGERE